jgi:hypothetical protein
MTTETSDTTIAPASAPAPAPQVQYQVHPGADGQFTDLVATHRIIARGISVRLILPRGVTLRQGGAARIWAAICEVAREVAGDFSAYYPWLPCRMWYYSLGPGRPYVATADLLGQCQVAWLEPAEVCDLTHRIEIKGSAVIAAMLAALRAEVVDPVVVDATLGDSPRGGWVLADYPVLSSPKPKQKSAKA